MTTLLMILPPENAERDTVNEELTLLYNKHYDVYKPKTFETVCLHIQFDLIYSNLFLEQKVGTVQYVEVTLCVMQYVQYIFMFKACGRVREGSKL